ncbi:MAG TPA: ankyrin repeat domain-containing protein [Pseudomonas sp.]|nr:ankyrin repeat domain-containing protein [Pseudomonas sp.]
MKPVFIALLCSITLPTWAGADQADPLADAQITCEEMRDFPDRVFTDDIDLGSGHGSPVAVDYHCPGGAASLPQMEGLLNLAERIRRQEVSQCSGSIVYAQARYYRFRLLMAGLAPTHFLALREASTPPHALEAYFANWAMQGPSNYGRYRDFLTRRSQARTALVAHYQAHAGLSSEEAGAVSDKLLRLVSHWAAGAFPGSSSIQENPPVTPTPLLDVIDTEAPDLQVIQTVLRGNPPQAEIDQALKRALYRQQPLAIIRELTSHLESLDSGHESALFFALQTPAALHLLLSRGAAVDYANSFGKTALFYAIENSDLSTLGTLLEHGANPNHAYKNAEALRALQCVTIDIKHSARTPLMHAAQHGDVAVLTLLLSKGARLTDVDDLGWNALDYATENEQLANAEYLRSVGATTSRRGE